MSKSTDIYFKGEIVPAAKSSMGSYRFSIDHSNPYFDMLFKEFDS